MTARIGFLLYYIVINLRLLVRQVKPLRNRVSGSMYPRKELGFFHHLHQLPEKHRRVATPWILRKQRLQRLERLVLVALPAVMEREV
jgi:hypothetical protein